MHLRRCTCILLVNEAWYLKLHVGSKRPTINLKKTITDTPAPANVTELKAPFGSFYCNKYLLSLPTSLAPLHQLQWKDGKWGWGKVQEKALVHSKQLLLSADVLVHYSPDRELNISYDALLQCYPIDGRLFWEANVYTQITIRKGEKNTISWIKKI